MLIKQIKHNSKEYQEAVDLRNTILRQLLGLILDEKDLQEEKSDIHIAFFENNIIIGTLILTPKDKNIVRIRQVAVANDYQGKGIGSKLVKFAEKFAIDHKFSKIILSSRNTALNFYKKNGYQTLGEEYVGKTIKVPHFEMIKYIA
ncbi:GNAT family N-acetyltransferase [bacterium]|nr:GNAT family N-acetyltransferase [bacterium]